MHAMRNFLLLSSALVVTLTAAGCGSSSLADPTPDPDVVTAMRRADSAVAGGGAAGGGGTGWGTIKGRFVYNGTPPTMGLVPLFDPTKDPLCKVRVQDESLLVDSGNKGIKNVLLYLAETDRVHPDFEKAPPGEAVFDQKECKFLTHVLAMSMKDKLVVLNSDNTGHNTNATPGRGNEGFNVLLEKVTGRYEYPGFKAALNFPFEAVCSIHPWMKGYIIARPDPYFAVTKEDGSFEIAKLPAGQELEIQVWHERAVGENHALRARPDWSSRGRFKVTIGKDGETVDLKEIVVEPSSFQ
jgi:hypothetical protein